MFQALQVNSFVTTAVPVLVESGALLQLLHVTSTNEGYINRLCSLEQGV